MSSIKIVIVILNEIIIFIFNIYVSIFCISAREAVYYPHINHLHEYRRRVLQDEIDDSDHTIASKNPILFVLLCLNLT